MRINVLQHTPNEGPGLIQRWSQEHGHEMYIYHPYVFGNLPTADQTDMLVILGGPMSPNDDLPWIEQERELIKKLLDAGKPILGVCYGAQQIVKTLGYEVKIAPHKEVGWAPVYRQSNVIPGLPEKMIVLHWHQDMFEVPDEAELLFSSDLVKNQAFILSNNVIGFQFHVEQEPNSLREIVVNDTEYPLDHNELHQTGADILQHGVPRENKEIVYKLLDYMTGK